MDEDDLLTSMWPCYQYRPCHIEICHIHIHVKENNIIVWHRHDTFFVCFNGWNINTFIQSVNQLIFVVVTIFLFYIFRLMVVWLYSHCRQLLMLFLMSCEILKCIKKNLIWIWIFKIFVTISFWYFASIEIWWIVWPSKEIQWCRT